jgi:hypothetical protein
MDELPFRCLFDFHGSVAGLSREGKMDGPDAWRIAGKEWDGIAGVPGAVQRSSRCTADPGP